MRFYRLDATDTIVATDPGWDSFALENGGAGAVAERLLGRTLWDCIAGSDTPAALHRLFYDARRSDTPWGMRYRCDSPQQERLFQLSATPVPGNGLIVRHALLRTRPRIRDVVKDLSRADRIWQCSQCLSYSTTAHWFAPVHIKGPLPGQEVIDCICADCRATIQPTWAPVLSQSIA
jgi:hypothetical protein